jgi:hypothetical protein
MSGTPRHPAFAQTHRMCTGLAFDIFGQQGTAMSPASSLRVRLLGTTNLDENYQHSILI